MGVDSVRSHCLPRGGEPNSTQQDEVLLEYREYAYTNL